MNNKIFTKKEIFAQLEALGAPSDRVVLVHTSLRAVGAVEGGAQGLLDVMIEYFTRGGGLLCIPAHTWHNLGREITLDMNSSDTCLGALAKVAAEDGRGIRTENPTHSMVIFGDRVRAEKFAENEARVTTPTAPEGCYGRLYSEGGYVLLIGVAQNRNTYLHSVDEMLKISNRMASNPEKVAVIWTTGEIIRRELTLYETDYTSDISERFVKYDTAFRYHRCVRDGFVGNAPTLLCDAVKMAEVVKLIYENSGKADPLCDEAPIPQRIYCNL